MGDHYRQVPLQTFHPIHVVPPQCSTCTGVSVLQSVYSSQCPETAFKASWLTTRILSVMGSDGHEDTLSWSIGYSPLEPSLIPRPRSAFRRLQYSQAGEGLVSFITITRSVKLLKEHQEGERNVISGKHEASIQGPQQKPTRAGYYHPREKPCYPVAPPPPNMTNLQTLPKFRSLIPLSIQ